MKNRVSPNSINSLEKGQVFVFGSNESGIHGAGAAKFAVSLGAVYGQPTGLQGRTYAIPTKNRKIVTLPLDSIKTYVDQFIEFARQNPHLQFLTTEIGCGLAGLTPEQIAPMFLDARNVENIYLPQKFWDVIG